MPDFKNTSNAIYKNVHYGKQAIEYIARKACSQNFDIKSVLEELQLLGTPQEGFIDKKLQTLKPSTVLESLIAVKKVINFVQFFPHFVT